MRVVAGDGVTLEPQIAAHAAELYAAIADPALYEFIDDKEPASETALRERLARLESRQSLDGTEHSLNWVVRTSSGQVAGYVQATVTADRSAEIAYVLARPLWRRGYGYAACSAMIRELVETYGVTRLTATLDPANSASLALVRKLGLGLVWSNEVAHEVGYALDLPETR